MADPAIEDVDLNIMGLDVSTLEAKWCQGIRGALCGISVCIIHKVIITLEKKVLINIRHYNYILVCP